MCAGGLFFLGDRDREREGERGGERVCRICHVFPCTLCSWGNITVRSGLKLLLPGPAAVRRSFFQASFPRHTHVFGCVGAVVCGPEAALPRGHLSPLTVC